MDGNLIEAFRRGGPYGLLLTLAFSTTAAIAAETTAPKIVSLAPSNTELLMDAGGTRSLVGVCSNCGQVIPKAKEQLKDVPVAGTFLNANLERLTRLKPDSILLVSGQEGIATLLKQRGFKHVLLHNDKLTDIPTNLRAIGKLSKTEKHADELANRFDKALVEFKTIIASAKTKPKIFYCTWAQPLLTIGKTSFLNDVVTTCGGINIAANLSQPYPHFSTEKLVLSDPDVVILPYDAKQQALFKSFPWNKLRATKENRVFYCPAPKEDMLSRPTLNVLMGLYWLSIKLHPELKQDLDKWHPELF